MISLTCTIIHSLSSPFLQYSINSTSTRVPALSYFQLGAFDSTCTGKKVCEVVRHSQVAMTSTLVGRMLLLSALCLFKFCSVLYYVVGALSFGLAALLLGCFTVILLQSAEDDVLWKKACYLRWEHVHVSKGGFHRVYSSLNGWRNPEFKRTILTFAV